MHYQPSIDKAFYSIVRIMHEIPFGYILRYTHSNGASIFFIVIYFHIMKAFYYQSYISPRQYVWMTGIIIYLIMVITAFLGYILVWGQMSYWGATVITSLVTTIPIYGTSILYWLWGGYAIENATINRF